MSEVTITIVIKGAGDTVSTAVSGGSGVGGPTPDVIPGGVPAAPQSTRPTMIAGQASGPVPTLRPGGQAPGAGPTPSALEPPGGSATTPTDRPPEPRGVPEGSPSRRQRGASRRA